MEYNVFQAPRVSVCQALLPIGVYRERRPLVSLTNAVLGPALKVALTWLGRRRLPKVNGTLQLSGLETPVEVIRDRWGVPHIYAETVLDLMLAQGFVHAQDRLWQMDFQRRLTAGRLSEVLGAEAVPVDRWIRTLGMRRVAEQEVSLFEADLHANLEAYTAGVNARIAQGRLPIEFTLLRYQPEPWVVADTLTWIKMMSWTLSVNWEAEILRARLIARLGPERAAELEPTYSAR
jgi:penicillin amidase